MVAALAGCGGDASGPETRGAGVERIAIRSEAVGDSRHVSVVVPGGGRRGRGLVLFLHGRGQSDRTHLVAPLFRELERLGDRAPIVAFPDGDESFWHDRGDGAWARYVLDEVLPEVRRRFDVHPRRVAIGGISMGGFGAADIARRHPGRFCALGLHSPALWLTAGETAEGAFDDAEDFAEHDVIAAAASVARATEHLWVDAGDEDPFRSGITALLDGVRAAGAEPVVSFPAGEHEQDYWSRHWPRYLRFYASALAGCAGPS